MVYNLQKLILGSILVNSENRKLTPPGPPPPHLPHFCKNFYRAQTWYKSSHDTPDGRPWGLPPVKKGFCKIQGGGPPLSKLQKLLPAKLLVVQKFA